MSKDLCLYDVLVNGLRIRSNLVNRSIKLKMPDDYDKKLNEEDLLKLARVDVNCSNEVKNCALFRFYAQNTFITVHFDLNVPSKIIKNMLKQNIMLIEDDNRSYEYAYFGQSASQLRTKTCILYNKTKHGDYEKLITSFGSFIKINDTAKRSARIGLLLSSHSSVLKLYDENVETIPDIEHDNYNFTDGCGLISVDYIEDISNSTNTGSQYDHYHVYKGPSVIQIRFKGCKGVLSASVDLKRKIQIRPSMEKFMWMKPEPHVLGVVDDGMSRPYTYAYLNKQYICILSANGIADEIFLKKQEKYFFEMDNLLNKIEYAWRYLCFWGKYDLAERLMKSQQIDNEIRAFLMGKKKSIITSQYENEKEKKSQAEALKVPIENSRNVFGIGDFSEKLESGQAFFQPTIDGKSKILHNTKIVVLKSPCYHPGDIKVLNCIDVPELRHLYDCIVFPTTGTRPHPDEIAGSDLDGDKYFVSWDEDLIPLDVHNPTSYQGCKSKPSEVTYEKLINFFADYNSTLVGMMSNLWCKWADLGGIKSPQCLALANLFSRAIDSAKSGESVRIPPELKNVPDAGVSSKQPVWLQMSLKAKSYVTKLVSEDNVLELMQDEELEHLIKSHEIRIDDYKLFRALYQHLYKNKPKKYLFNRLLDYISLDYFNKEQLKALQIDCPHIDPDYLMNSIYRSKILRRTFASQIQSDQKLNWSLYYSIDYNQTIDWNILNDFLEQNCNKLLVFQFDMSGTRRIIAIRVNYPIKLHECTDTIGDSHYKSYANVYLCIDDHSSTFYLRQINEEFVWALDGRRLQVFIGNRQRTFVCLMEDENNNLSSLMSVALDFFDRNLLKKYPKLRKDKIIKAEFYSDMGLKDPFLTKSFEYSTLAASLQSENSNQYEYKPFDFPSLNESVNFNEKSETRRAQFEQIKDAIENKLKNSEEVEQELILKCINMLDIKYAISYEIMNYLINLLARGQHFGDVWNYMRLINNLIEMTPTSLNLKQIWLDKISTVVDSIRRHNVILSLQAIQDIIYKIIFTQSCRGVFAIEFLNIIKVGYLPLNDEMIKSEKHAYYYSYWTALLSIDFVCEVEEAEHKSKNLEIVAMADALSSEQKIGEMNLWYINLRDASINFELTDIVALTSCAGYNSEDYPYYEPEIFCKIIKQVGRFLTVQVIWPNDCQIDTKIAWRVDRFPGLITFKRLIDGLNLHVYKNNENSLSNFVVSSFYEQIKAGNHEDLKQNLPSELIEQNGDLEKNEDIEFIYLKSANKSQEDAIKLCTSDKKIILVHGPPGTGKSEVACEIIAQWEKIGKVLVVAETNEAVNNVLIKLRKKGFDFAKILRVGSRNQLNNEIFDCTIEKRYYENYKQRVDAEFMDKSKAQKIINASKVVFTTCSSSMLSFMIDIKFQFLIVDEAAQAFEPAVMMALRKDCQKICLIGDHRQLPPLVKSQSIKDELSVTLFDRLSKIIEPIMLNIQFRMNPIIAKFPSSEFYEDKLLNGVSIKDRMGIESFKWPDKNHPLVFINIDSKEKKLGSSKLNEGEADFIKFLYESILKTNEIEAKDIGIITAYKAQVNLLKQLLGNKSTIDTVDGFQGQEREIIIFSAVRSNDYGDVGFLTDRRRLNVSFTRAKKGLIVIGNEKTLRNDDLWNRWLTWVVNHNFRIQSTDFDFSKVKDTPKPKSSRPYYKTKRY